MTIAMSFVLGLAILIALAVLLVPNWPGHAPNLVATPDSDATTAPRPPEPRATTPAFQPQGAHALIPDGVYSVATVAGPLAIVPAKSQDQLTLAGKRLALPGPYFSLLAIHRHPDQDVVLIGMRCNAACTYQDLAFVRIFKTRAPLVEMRPDFRVPSGEFDSLARHITFTTDATTVELGLEKGSRISARIGASQPLELVRSPAKAIALSSGECWLVRSMVSACAGFRTPCRDADFKTFPQNCPGATTQMRRTVIRLADQTTGFDAPAFAKVCVKASQLGIAPSDDFIRREICSGADRRQWQGD